MNHKLGMHWLRYHQDGRDLEHIERMQYRSFKPFQWMWNNRDFCRDLLMVLPKDAYILARDHPLSEQKEDMWRDPVNTGYRHANEWANKVRSGDYHLPIERTFFLGINEPDATNGDRAAIDHYNTAFLDRLAAHGFRGGAFNFSTGHPRTVDGTPNTPADYSVFEGTHQAITRGHHIAVAHIYGAFPHACVPGHFDRMTACPWTDVEWVIGELGLDQHTITGGAHDGFHAFFNDNLGGYCWWIDDLIMGVETIFPFIHSYQVFTFDYSHPWGGFDIRAIREALESYDWQHSKAKPTPQAIKPHTTHLPNVLADAPVEEGKPMDTWQRSRAFVRRWEGGYSVNPEDHGNWTGGRKGEGELKGTNFGISAGSYPHLDIANLTIEQADAIYHKDYWQASGADKLPWPACLIVFDTAVLHGVGTARKWQAEVGTNAFAFAAKRLRVYTKMDNWHYFGSGWVNRVAELLDVASQE